MGKEHAALIKRPGEPLFMDGRRIFNFVMRTVPGNIKRCLEANGLSLDRMDRVLLHQASRYVIDNLVKAMKLDPDKTPFGATDYGNTVSSSIPLLLEPELDAEGVRAMLLCGYGVGLSTASVTLRRK